LIYYSYKEQIIDMFPSLLRALAMFGCVLLAGRWCKAVAMADIVIIAIQIVIGVGVYLILSIVTKSKQFYFLLEQGRKLLKK